MSFSEEPTHAGWQIAGCMIIGLIGAGVGIFGLMIASLGHCASEIDGTGCENEGLTKFLWLPGAPLLFLALGAGLLWLFAKNRKR